MFLIDDLWFFCLEGGGSNVYSVYLHWYMVFLAVFQLSQFVPSKQFLLYACVDACRSVSEVTGFADILVINFIACLLPLKTFEWCFFSFLVPF